MFGFGKKQQPVKVKIPVNDLPLDKIIDDLSNQELHNYPPFSDDIQSLLTQLGSDFKTVNRDGERPGTNVDRVTLLCVALLLRKMK